MRKKITYDMYIGDGEGDIVAYVALHLKHTNKGNYKLKIDILPTGRFEEFIVQDKNEYNLLFKDYVLSIKKKQKFIGEVPDNFTDTLIYHFKKLADEVNSPIEEKAENECDEEDMLDVIENSLYPIDKETCEECPVLDECMNEREMNE